MGLLSGSATIRRYEVLGEPPKDFRESYEEAVQKNAFTDFNPGDEREETSGWVPMDDWFDPYLGYERWFFDNYINLCLRVDAKRIPAKYFKQQCRNVQAEWKLKAGREDLTRAERDEIESIVRKQLLERVIPSCQGNDMSWDLDKKVVYFLNASDKANDLFQTTFSRTFGLKLRLLFPYSLAVKTLGKDNEEIANRVVPASFIPAGIPAGGE